MTRDRPNVRAFMHAKLDVSDLERSELFYRDLLGLTEVVRYNLPAGAIVQYSPTGSSPGVELWFEEGRTVAPPTECHIAFVVDDARAWVDYLRSRHVTVEQEPFVVGGETIAFVRDPDGYLVELNQQPDET